ncbi:MAG: hypothetical protein ACI9N1_000820 [Flavobacteriales bacterium]|jgi:hypothetical protein
MTIMNNPTTPSTLKVVLSVFMFTFGLQVAIMYFACDDKNIFLPFIINGFLFGAILLGQFIMKKVQAIDPSKVGMTFLAITMFKMLFSVLMLLLLFKLFPFERMVIILHFFGPFFLYLFCEVYLSMKLLKINNFDN